MLKPEERSSKTSRQTTVNIRRNNNEKMAIYFYLFGYHLLINTRCISCCADFRIGTTFFILRKNAQCSKYYLNRVNKRCVTVKI